MSDDIIILCHENPEFPNRNFAIEKDFGEIVYCTEIGCKNQEYCALKRSIQNWR